MTAALLANDYIHVESCIRVYKIIKNRKETGFFRCSVIGKVMIYVYPALYCYLNKRSEKKQRKITTQKKRKKERERVKKTNPVYGNKRIYLLNSTISKQISISLVTKTF